MKKTIGSLCLFFLSQIVFGQDNSKLLPYAENISYTPENKIIFAKIKAASSVGESGVVAFLNTTVFNDGINKVSVQKTEKDALGFTHIKYNILQNGVLLSNKVIIAHCKDGKLVSVNGDLSDLESADNSYAITESQALAYAVQKVNAKKYKWDNKAEERHMREALNDPAFTYQPIAEKIILEKEGKLYKTYRFNIYAEEPLYRAYVFVDAGTGKVLEEQNLICTTDAPGTAVTKYSGNQNLTNDYTGSLYRLRETQRGLGIETYNIKNTMNYGAASDFTNTSSSWTSTGNDQAATDAHWGAEMTYDYYLNEHNRNSINNAGFKLLSYVHYTVSYTNAFWDGSRMTYGDGDGNFYKIFTGLDVCGHEITHGLTANTANLAYTNESGALNEAFSDIFGESIENYSRPNNWSWKIGEDITNGQGLRDMSNPHSFQNPDTYGGQYYYNGTADNGGVHTNSGVANYWFYLLTSGGTGTNSINHAYAVTGLGFTDAAKIAFRALTVYFTPTTNYASARLLSIQAARDLYGDCSNEVIQTTKAWYAVGVGANYINGVVPNFAANATNFCSAPATVNFSNTTANGLTYNWNFGDGGTATGTNTIHTYTAVGIYSIKLNVVGCSNVLDSLTKTSYIVINPPVSNPAATDGAGCEGGSAILTATGSSTIKWYDSPNGGIALGVGNIFSTPTITASTTYYAANTLTLANVLGGRLFTTTGGGISGTTANYLLFDVFQNGVLNSVVMYAQTTGNRVVQLRNSANQALYTTTVNLAVGSNTVILNYNLTPGANYRLGLANGSGTNIYRSTTGLNYPYNIGGFINITSSSTGNSAYYFFYSWNISKEECASPRIPVIASLVPAPNVTMNAPLTPVCSSDMIDLQGSPAGGVYQGNGMTNGIFNASALGSGTYSVEYFYSDANTCTNTAQATLIVEECTGISKINAAGNAIQIYPNPAKDNLVVNSGIANAAIYIADASGRLILSKELTNSQEKIKLDAISNGMYIISVKDGSGNTIKTMKLIKE